MKIIVAALAVVLFASFGAYADWYQWTGKDGVLHITDDLGKIPENERAGAEVFQVSPPEEAEEPAAATEEYREEPAQPAAPADELYEGETAEWWQEELEKKTTESKALETDYLNKKTFVDLFNSGRRFGQIYEPKDVARYKEYVDELPGLEKEVAAKKSELETLRTQARRAGVPGL